MIRIRCFSIYSIGVMLVFSFPVASQTNGLLVTLQYCQDQAIANFPTAKDKALLQTVSSYRINNLDAGRLPQVALNGQASYQSDAISITSPIINVHQSKDQYKATLDINQLIYDGGTTRFQKQLENSSYEVDAQQVDVDLYKLKEQVNNVYFLLLILQENRKLLTATMNEISEREKTVSSSVKNGVLTASDLDVLTAERLRTEQQLSEIDINKKASLQILSILMSQTLSDSSGFELPVISVTDTSLIARPEYKWFELQEKRIDDSKQLTQTSLKPKVYAFAQAGYGRPGLNMLDDKFNPFYIVGANMKWTILDWNKNSRERKILDIQKQMVTTRKETFEKNLNMDLQNKLSSIRKLEEALNRDSQIVELRSRVVRASTSKLDNGVITSTDYLTDLNAETIAKINLETHKIQLVQARENYLIAKGK
jgi:outer membrane protein TolC